MNSLQRQERIVEKVLKTKAGQYVRAVFLVYEVSGKLEARLLSAKPVPDSKFQILDSKFQKTTIVCLPVKKQASVQRVPLINRLRTSSPYFNIFSFFTSQPTRAPSA